MDAWKFRFDIALPLESYGKKIIGESCSSADEIMNGGYIDTMLQILSIVYGRFDEIRAFAELCDSLKSLTVNELEQSQAEKVFNEFKRLLNIRSDNWR